VVEYNGFADPHAVCRESPWKRLPNGTTFCSAIAKWVAQYEKKIFPVDGDIFSMFYRRDVLKAL
jgi:hypothetical protein